MANARVLIKMNGNWGVVFPRKLTENHPPSIIVVFSKLGFLKS